MGKLEDMGWSPEEAAAMRRIDPAVRDRVLNLLAATPDTPHFVEVSDDQGTNGYPFRAVCICGWRSWSYASRYAATLMGQDHTGNPGPKERGSWGW